LADLGWVGRFHHRQGDSIDAVFGAVAPLGASEMNHLRISAMALALGLAVSGTALGQMSPSPYSTPNYWRGFDDGIMEQKMQSDHDQWERDYSRRNETDELRSRLCAVSPLDSACR
jgi:hypothetical protein